MRFDSAGQLKKVRKTPQGGVSAPAYLTRTGVFVYRYMKPDGESVVVRELRHPDEVFKESSLATLHGAPITIGHPQEVTPDNWREVSVGTVGDNVKKDSRFVSATVRVQDKDAVDKVVSGELVELSCGYHADTVIESGVYNGQPYDAVQRNIQYNHVALLPKGGGRAGSEVKLRLDGSLESTYYIGMYLDDKDSQAPDHLDALVAEKTLTAKLTAEKAELAAVNSDLQKKFDCLTGERDQLVSDLSKSRAEVSSERIDSLVSQRVALFDSARVVLGTDFEFSGKSEREVFLAVISKSDSKFDAKGRSDDYLRGRFEAAVESYSDSERANGEAAKILSGKKDASDGPSDPVEAARLRMIKKNQDKAQGK